MNGESGLRQKQEESQVSILDDKINDATTKTENARGSGARVPSTKKMNLICGGKLQIIEMN